MTINELIALLRQVPGEYDAEIYRGGAYSSARSVDVNDQSRQVFISDEEPEA